MKGKINDEKIKQKKLQSGLDLIVEIAIRLIKKKRKYDM